LAFKLQTQVNHPEESIRNALVSAFFTRYSSGDQMNGGEQNWA
jgi:hypothetical protein